MTTATIPNGKTMDEQQKPDQLAKRPTGVITTQDENTSSLKRWQSQNFHILTPASNFSALPESFGLIASMVQIDPNPAPGGPGEVYQDGVFVRGDDVALTKLGLSKIAQCAGLSITTTRTDPRTIPHYWEVQAVAKWRGFDGAVQSLSAMVEFDLRNDSPRVAGFSEKQIKQARVTGLRGAESRAINAAIRQFGIKQKYTREELKKPFVVLRMVYQPDMTNPLIAAAVANQALAGTEQLYPNRPAMVEGEVLDRIGGPEAAVVPAEAPNAGPVVAEDKPPTPNAVRIIQIIPKDGMTNGRKWTKYDVVDHLGVVHSTFDKKVIEVAEKFKTERAWVDVISEESEDKKYRNIVEIASAQPGLPLESTEMKL